MLGSNRREFVLVGAWLLISLAWFADILRELIIARSIEGLLSRPMDMLLLASFPITACIVYQLGARALREAADQVRITTQEWPGKAKALLLFLSPSSMNQAAQDSIQGDLLDPTQQRSILDRIGRSPWRMPFEAIAYHLPELERIVVIPSRNEEWHGRYEPIAINGTAKEVGDFIVLVSRLTKSKPVLVQDAAGLLSEEGLAGGVGFYNPQEIADVCNRCIRKMHDDVFHDAEIMVDVTGGYTVTTAAAAAVTIARGRRFQCVDMHGYRIRSFDIEYDPAGS